ncbi:hypothetical protein G7054_g14763 [Neopestalotiopsis clavispora]|nr:hypothetical protein G7054_g14763 [Neopestalotiopsis clavispora]
MIQKPAGNVNCVHRKRSVKKLTSSIHGHLHCGGVSGVALYQLEVRKTGQDPRPAIAEEHDIQATTPGSPGQDPYIAIVEDEDIQAAPPEAFGSRATSVSQNVDSDEPLAVKN